MRVRTGLAVAILCIAATPASAELVYFPSGRALSVKAVRAAVPARYRDLIESSGQKHGVDPTIVHAVIQVESAYHSRAVVRRRILRLLRRS